MLKNLLIDLSLYQKAFYIDNSIDEILESLCCTHIEESIEAVLWSDIFEPTSSSSSSKKKKKKEQ